MRQDNDQKAELLEKAIEQDQGHDGLAAEAGDSVPPLEGQTSAAVPTLAKPSAALGQAADITDEQRVQDAEMHDLPARLGEAAPNE